MGIFTRPWLLQTSTRKFGCATWLVGAPSRRAGEPQGSPHINGPCGDLPLTLRGLNFAPPPSSAKIKPDQHSSPKLGATLPDQKDPKEPKDESFKVIDRRPFTAEGELRPEALDEERREREAAEPG